MGEEKAKERDKDKEASVTTEDSVGETSTEIASTWNESQEHFLKGISERANCMRWLHNQCNLYFESLNFYFTIPNVIISTLNGSFTMSLNALFPDRDSQQYATTVIGLISILSAVLITMNQYVKSQQMMEAHRSAALAYGKLHRTICNELAIRRDQRSNAIEFLKIVRSEQDRLESTSPSILPRVILKFNRQFADRNIEKPEIAGDLDETEINHDTRESKTILGKTLKVIHSASELLFSKLTPTGSSPKPYGNQVAPEPNLVEDNHVLDMMVGGVNTVTSQQKDLRTTLVSRKPVLPPLVPGPNAGS